MLSGVFYSSHKSQRTLVHLCAFLKVYSPSLVGTRCRTQCLCFFLPSSWDPRAWAGAGWEAAPLLLRAGCVPPGAFIRGDTVRTRGVSQGWPPGSVAAVIGGDIKSPLASWHMKERDKGAGKQLALAPAHTVTFSYLELGKS